MCGILGLIGSENSAREAFLGLTTLQHRGQDGAGILTHSNEGFHSVKNIGLVENVFSVDNIATLKGGIALGHVRYSTIGRGNISDVQPFLLSYPFGLGIVHNGNIINYEPLSELLKNKYRRHLLTHSDTEVLLHLFAQGLSHTPAVEGKQNLEFEDICKAASLIYENAIGSFSLVILIAGFGLVALRDPAGIRPLVLGKRKTEQDKQTVFTFASESSALSILECDNFEDVKPGEVVFIDYYGNIKRKIIKQDEHKHCMFENVYFASPESTLNGENIYGSRIKLGRHLAKEVRERIINKLPTPDVVVPVPDSSRVAAIALAEEMKLPYREVLIKNRYITRTFILDSNQKRQKAVNLKLAPVKEELKGKTVLLVDDSIVRGTTSRKIISLVRRAGAKNVYFVATCPPIRYPCFYGIDFPVQEELLAFEKTLQEIELELGADAVVYQNLDGLFNAVKTKSDAVPCMACLNGKYPTDIKDARSFARDRLSDRNYNRSLLNSKKQEI